MASWSMSEFGRASIIVPLIFRYWLKQKHIRNVFLGSLAAQFPVPSRPNNLSDVDLVVRHMKRLT